MITNLPPVISTEAEGHFAFRRGVAGKLLCYLDTGEQQELGALSLVGGLLCVVAVGAAVGGQQHFGQLPLTDHPGAVHSSEQCMELQLGMTRGYRCLSQGQKRQSSAAVQEQSWCEPRWVTNLSAHCGSGRELACLTLAFLCFGALVPAASLFPPCAGILDSLWLQCVICSLFLVPLSLVPCWDYCVGRWSC